MVHKVTYMYMYQWCWSLSLSLCVCVCVFPSLCVAHSIYRHVVTHTYTCTHFPWQRGGIVSHDFMVFEKLLCWHSPGFFVSKRSVWKPPVPVTTCRVRYRSPARIGGGSVACSSSATAAAVLAKATHECEASGSRKCAKLHSDEKYFGKTPRRKDSADVGLFGDF